MPSTALAVVAALALTAITASANGKPLKDLEKIGRIYHASMKGSERVAARAAMPASWLRELDERAVRWTLEQGIHERLPEIRFRLPQGFNAEVFGLTAREMERAPDEIAYENGKRVAPDDEYTFGRSREKDRVQCLLRTHYGPLRELPAKSVLKTKGLFSQYDAKEYQSNPGMPLEIEIDLLWGGSFRELRCLKVTTEDSKRKYISIGDIEKAFGDYVFFVEIPDSIFYTYIGFRWTEFDDLGKLAIKVGRLELRSESLPRQEEAQQQNEFSRHFWKYLGL